jgi:uncharacterized protein involved in exopolysaccharide biosynthesis
MEVEAGSGAGRSRHWSKVILIPTLLAALMGFLISYAFTPKYTSQSLVLVEGQQVPENMVQPLVDQDLTERIETLQQEVVSQSSLQPLVDQLGLVKPGQDAGAVMDTIRANMAIEPVETDLSQVGPSAGKREPSKGSAVPGFYVEYTASSALEAQRICNGLTSLMLTENDKFIQGTSQGITDFLRKELEDARQNLEAIDAQFLERTKDRASRSSEGEEKYKTLALEHEIEKKSYTDLLSELSKAQATAKLTKDMEAAQLGEQMKMLEPASLPDSLDFPNRLLFAGGGLSAGPALRIGLALRLRFRQATS